jgi:hypothetical protein
MIRREVGGLPSRSTRTSPIHTYRPVVGHPLLSAVAEAAAESRRMAESAGTALVACSAGGAVQAAIRKNAARGRVRCATGVVAGEVG